MADNTTQGGADTIRTKDRSGVKTDVALIDVSDGADAEQLGLGKNTPIIGTSAGLTTATTAYTAGDQLGTEITFTSIVRTNRGGIIQQASLVDKAKVIGAVDLYLFSAATTPAADNAANAWSDADMLNLIGVIHFNDVIVSANNYAVLATNLPFVIKPSTGNVFGNLVTRTGHTFFGAVGDLQVRLGVSQD